MERRRRWDNRQTRAAYGVYTTERTQVYLEAQQRKKLAKIATGKGTTVSQLVRDAISSYIEAADDDAPERRERIEDNPLWGLSGLIKAEPGAPTTYGSTTYKEDLYGDKRGPWPVSS
jgi:hypothetical protein